MVNPEIIPDKNKDGQWGKSVKRSDGKDRIWTGIFLLIVGGVALARSFQVPLPDWIFSWQSFLIILGIFIGIRNNFEGPGWFMLILIGVAFLLNDFYFGGDLRKHLWPLILILIGGFFILRSRHESHRWRKEQTPLTIENTGPAKREGNFADVTVIFGAVKKTFSTPNFAGGDVTTVFGGVEIDLTESDIVETAMIDLTTIFGGIELIVPSDWTIKSELTSILASVNDKRIHSPSETENPKKVLILEGTAMFAGIEIKSFKK